MEKWEDWRIALSLPKWKSELALCRPSTSTIVLPGGDPGKHRRWDPMEIGLNDKLVKKGLTLDLALCGPLTSTPMMPEMDLGEHSRWNPMGIGLNPLVFWVRQF